jgi:hypothetical protein
MLSMGFVSLLLLAIAMTVIQIGNTYNRGLTLTNANQAGSVIDSDLQRTIAQTTPFMLDANNYIVQSWGGRLCTGQYSYIWNNGSDIYNKNPSINKYSNSSNTIFFVKDYDPSASDCKAVNGIYPSINSSTAVDLLNETSNNNLAIQSFTVSSIANDPTTGQRLYNIEFFLGTNDQTALNSNSQSCKPPSDINSDFNYCAVVQFDITVMAGNVGNVVE